MSFPALRTSIMRSCGTITTPSTSPNTKSPGWITVSPILIGTWYSRIFQRPIELAGDLNAAKDRVLHGVDEVQIADAAIQHGASSRAGAPPWTSSPPQCAQLTLPPPPRPLPCPA